MITGLIWNELLFSFYAIVFLFYLIRVVIRRVGDAQKRLLLKVSSYCYGIYLYAEPLNYLILFLTYAIGGISAFGSEAVSIGIIVLRVFGTSAIAIGMTCLFKKMKLIYLY